MGNYESISTGNDNLTKIDSELVDNKSASDRMGKMFQELEEYEKKRNVEEGKILEVIKHALETHGLKYNKNFHHPRIIDMGFGTDNKFFRTLILLDNYRVVIRLAYPFMTQRNALALVSLYMMKFNENKTFSHLNLDLEDGEITMEYSFILRQADSFDDEEFMTYLMSMVHAAQEIYVKVSHLAVGKLSKKDKDLYRKLIEESLKVLDGQDDEEDITYGCGDLIRKRNLELEMIDALKEKVQDQKTELVENEYDFCVSEPSYDVEENDIHSERVTMTDFLREQRQKIVTGADNNGSNDKDLIFPFTDDSKS